jgi:DNA-binding transcriptional regulator PaaX
MPIFYFFLWCVIRIVTLGPSAYEDGPKHRGGAAEISSNLNLIREFGVRELLPRVELFELGIGSKKANTSRPGDMGWP